MRKQLAIGVSVLALTALGGVSESDFILINQQGADSQYTHLVKTSLNQFEPLSGASLLLDLPNRNSFQATSVQFITGGDNLDFGNMDFTDPTIEQCQRYGYSLTSCGAGQLQGLKCPYNSAYFDRCCDGRYKYDKSACNYPNTVSSDSCGGKYMCYCDRSLYPETKCASPMVAESGDSCIEDGVTYYAQCVCPSSYSQTCDGLNQEGSGEGCTQNGVTKYTSCQCKSGYNMTCSDFGPTNPSDYCLMNGIKYYNDCKTCEKQEDVDPTSCSNGTTLEDDGCGGTRIVCAACSSQYKYDENNCPSSKFFHCGEGCDSLYEDCYPKYSLDENGQFNTLDFLGENRLLSDVIFTNDKSFCPRVKEHFVDLYDETRNTMYTYRLILDAKYNIQNKVLKLCVDADDKCLSFVQEMIEAISETYKDGQAKELNITSDMECGNLLFSGSSSGKITINGNGHTVSFRYLGDPIMEDLNVNNLNIEIFSTGYYAANKKLECYSSSKMDYIRNCHLQDTNVKTSGGIDVTDVFLNTTTSGTCNFDLNGIMWGAHYSGGIPYGKLDITPLEGQLNIKTIRPRDPSVYPEYEKFRVDLNIGDGDVNVTFYES